MSYQDKVKGALALISAHNDVIGSKPGTDPGAKPEPNPGHVDPEQFRIGLVAMATNEAQLKSLDYDEIGLLLPSTKLASGASIKPAGLIKEIAKLFRDKTETATETRPVSSRRAETMTPRQLVESFDPAEPENPVGKRLKDMSRGQPFLVYSIGRTVDVETSFKLLSELRDGYPARPDIDVNGVVKSVYRIGDIPDNYAEENPLWHGRPLRPDGTCDQTGRSWSGVPLAVRQIAYLAVQTGEVDVSAANGLNTAHEVINLAMKASVATENPLRQRYRKASKKFDELENLGKLPTLKIALAKAGEGRRPFDGGRKVMLPTNYVPVGKRLHKKRNWDGDVFPANADQARAMARDNSAHAPKWYVNRSPTWEQQNRNDSGDVD